MIPILYPSTELNFITNGIGRLVNAISCTVTEERNGKFEAVLRYPVTGQHFEDIKEGCILWLIHDDTKTGQPFDIYAHTAPLNGVVTFRAHHISYRQNNVILQPFKASSIAEAFVKLQTSCANENPFTYWTDKEVAASFEVDAPVSVKEMLGGRAGSILDVYGKGEYEWDKWTVRFHLNRGSDTDVQIRYGKNLSGLTQDYDTSCMYSAVAPYWKSLDGEVVMLPEVILIASNLPVEEGFLITEKREHIATDQKEDLLFARPIIKPVPLDLSDRWEEVPTEEQLREAGMRALEDGWKPDENINVNFVQLWQTAEYESVAPLQRVRLCDTVSIYFPELGVIAKKQKVIKVVYNVLLERYDSMELGMARASFSETIKADVEAAIIKQVPTASTLSAAIDAATKLITGGLGGHVVFGFNADRQPNEILIMDTEDVLTAVNIIRFNMAGIGFSTSGYNGPYRNAWTIDGHLVADFIDTGTLSANLIKAGILTDVAGKHYWNLLTGEMAIGQIHVVENAIYSGSKSTFASTSQGFYLGANGDFVLGDDTSYLQWTASQRRLDLAVSSLTVGGDDIAMESEIIFASQTAHAEALDAAKTATNYLYYDASSGLVVSTTGEAATGYNTQITASGINFRSGATILSSLTSSQYVINRAATGLPAMSLSGTALNFYKPDGQTVAATINANGLEVESGTVGGWTITADQIKAEQQVGNITYKAYLNRATSNITYDAFAVAVTDADAGTITYPFRVRYDGSLAATNANVSGTITSQDGSIGGWVISDRKLTGNTIELDSRDGRIRLGSFVGAYGRTAAYIDRTGECSFGTVYCEGLYVGDNPSSLDWAFSVNRTAMDVNITPTFYQSMDVQGMTATTAGYPAVFMISGANARLAYNSSSSIRYKDVLRNMTALDVQAAYKIQPVLAKYKAGYLDENDERVSKYFPMFIAENVAEYIPDAVNHKDGQIETWNDRIMIPIHHQMLIDLERRIAALEREVRA